MSSVSDQKKINLSEAIPLDTPLVMYIDVTNKCNFSCSFCPTGNKLQNTMTKNSGTMSMEVFDKIVEDLKVLTKKTGKKIKSIGLYMMGEPLINKHFFEMTRKIKDADVALNLAISTNGSLIKNDEICEKLIKSGLDNISISMYGISDEDYSKVNKRFSFNDILDNSDRFLRLRKKIGVKKPRLCHKYFEKTEKHKEMEKFLQSHCDLITYEKPFNWSSNYSKGSGKVIRGKRFDVKYCSSPWYVMSIGWDGSVLTCCADWGWHTKTGNIMETSIQEVWKGKALYLFRKNIVEGKQSENLACKGCTFHKLNTGPLSSLDELIETDPDKAILMPSY